MSEPMFLCLFVVQLPLNIDKLLLRGFLIVAETEEVSIMEDLYRETTGKGLYEIVAKPKWATAVFYEGKLFEFAWCDYFRVVDGDNELMQSGFRVLVDGEIPQDGNLNAQHKVILQNIVKVRMVEVREELLKDFGFEDKYFYSSNIDRLAEMIMKIYERVCAGEFVGQYLDFIYVQEVAEILDVKMEKVLEVIAEKLRPEKKLDLNGMILWDYEKIARTRQIAFEKTGHRDLDRSDFGNWYCFVCKQGGDERDDPKEVPCLAD